MIEAIEIENLRGIRVGRLDALNALTVLVGPSGSGKSTVLDALLIGGSPNPGDAIGRTVRRRAELPAGAPWLFTRRTTEATVRLREAGSKDLRTTGLRWQAAGNDSYVVAHVAHSRLGTTDYFASIRPGNDYDCSPSSPTDALAKERYLRLVDTEAGANHASLVRVYEQAFQAGRADLVNEVVRAVL